jgi:hypothetical protein
MSKDNFHLHLLKQTRDAHVTIEDLAAYRRRNNIPARNEQGTPITIALVKDGNIVLMED